MIHYNDKYLRYIEWEIRTTHDNRMDIEDYTQCECLLELRQDILNEQALANQKFMLGFLYGLIGNML